MPFLEMLRAQGHEASPWLKTGRGDFLQRLLAHRRRVGAVHDWISVREGRVHHLVRFDHQVATLTQKRGRASLRVPLQKTLRTCHTPQLHGFKRTCWPFSGMLPPHQEQHRLSVWQRRVTRRVMVMALGRGCFAEDILFRHRTKLTVLNLVVERQCPLVGPAVQPEREASGRP